MKITNHFNIPYDLESVVSEGAHPPKAGRYSITSLIGPPLIRTLSLEHWDELEQDVSDCLWMLLGSGVDAVLSGAEKDKTQHKIVLSFEGVDIVGVLDHISGDTIGDWKCTSTYSYLYGIKPEWVAQLNCYDYMYTITEKVVINNLKIYAILRDWQKSKSTYDPKYPKIPFVTLDIPRWSLQEQQDYIAKQLADHQDNPHRECTDEEKWRSPDTYAVKKKGKKRAERVLDTWLEAENWLVKNRSGEGGYVPSAFKIEKRSGYCRRCVEYCNVRSVCEYV